MMVKGRSLVPHMVISILILIETTSFLATSVLDGPLWFEVMSGLALVIGVYGGHFAGQSFIYGK